MKNIFIAISLLALSLSSFAEENPKAKLQKGAAVEYCTTGSPNSRFVRGSGEQREVTVTIEYSDSTIDMIVEPPFAIGGATVIPGQVSSTYCYILTKL